MISTTTLSTAKASQSSKQFAFEKISTSIFENSKEASLAVAHEIEALIKKRQAEGKKVVLGLATGSTPKQLYDYLILLHKENGLSFKNVITFNLDEYYPMPPRSLQSYARFMKEHLFAHIDIDPKNVHIPKGDILQEDVQEHCREYETKIKEAGGIDIQIVGIGRTGHIGFNEPGSCIESTTRMVQLDKTTRQDAASDFFGEAHVPRTAITMGMGTIMAAERIILLAWGENKSAIIKQAVEGEITTSIPATFLQHHKNCHAVLDQSSAALLTRMKTPWLYQDCQWTEALVKKATIWLSEKKGKAILKLTENDYHEHGMGKLLTEKGSAERINLSVFNQLQATISGWPGGKPKADDHLRPERAQPFPKTSVIFSPHPDDDVISMGGTLLRLVAQGHDVHIAYQTSGNIAVFDDEVLRFMAFTTEIQEDNLAFQKKYGVVKSYLENKLPGQMDSPYIQQIKGLIRKGEALAACRYCGVPEINAHFLNLPFYETGSIRKKPYSEKDIERTYQLLSQLRPHQIFAAGDLSDPHGTHRVCLEILLKTLERFKAENASWISNCNLWLYRGAWQEWEIAEMDMAVPLGPMDIIKKRKAIFKHQSQKDKAMFPGSDEREFWQRAEQRNRTTANRYNALGMTEYEGMEGFVKYAFC